MINASERVDNFKSIFTNILEKVGKRFIGLKVSKRNRIRYVMVCWI